MAYAVATAGLFACLFVWARWFRKDPATQHWKDGYVRLANDNSEMENELMETRIRVKQSVREDDLTSRHLRVLNHNDALEELTADFVVDLRKLCERVERRANEVALLGEAETVEVVT